MKKILITGSSGLVGKETVKELLTGSDYEIFAATSKNLKSVQERLRYINNSAVEEILKTEKIDVLLQLAFPRNVEEDQWAGGMEFVAHILGLAKKYDVKKIVNVSSQSIYGWQRKTYAVEGDAVYLNSPYTTGKYFTELMVNELFAGIYHTNVRLSTTIGPTTRERVPNKLFAQIMAGKELNIKGGKQIFSFLDVRDAASGLTKLITSDGKFRSVYNLGTSEYVTLLELAEMTVKIAEEYGYKSKINVEDADIVLNNMIDTSAMEKDFGWRAKFSLSETLKYIFCKNYMK